MSLVAGAIDVGERVDGCMYLCLNAEGLGRECGRALGRPEADVAWVKQRQRDQCLGERVPIKRSFCVHFIKLD